MPEGPEVKIMSDYVNEVLSGHIITNIECVSQPYFIKYGSLVDTIQSYLPFVFKDSFCVGKASFIYLNKDTVFSYHLGMTGFWSTQKKSHAHLKLKTSTGLCFYFHDTRRFGNIKVLSNSKLLFNEFYNGDFLNFDFDIESYALHLYKTINTSKEVCKVLLDQRYFAGIGNYLKSEILYSCGIHPHKLWNSLSLDEVISLCKISKFMLFKSYKGGGAQLKDFKNPSKAPDLNLLIYGKTHTHNNLPVTSEITKDNRRTFWCPTSQVL
jgi:DNA-formamidopyrimidine glycosylase